MTADHGAAETAYRAWVATLGTLSPLQTAHAERLYALARQLDLPDGRPAGALSSISRAITKVSEELRDAKNGAGQPIPEQKPPEPGDVVDEVAAKRARRLGGTA